MIEKILAEYQPSQEVTQLVRTTPLVLMVGVSGAGKDTIKRALLQTGRFHEFVSYTTRPPRMNHGVAEQDGVDYHFVSKEKMLDLLRAGQMIEAKQYSGNVYGTGIADLLHSKESGKIAINDIEVNGVREYKKISQSIHAIFILPPSYEEWMSRLKKRYSGNMSDKDNIEARLHTSQFELEDALASGYYEFVINDEIDFVTQKIISIIDHGMSDIEKNAGIQKAQELLGQVSTH